MLNFRPHKIFVKNCQSGGGVDDNNDPLSLIYDWGEAIPCRFETDSREAIFRYEDGSAHVFDYVVWIDPISHDLTGKMVKLVDQFGNEKPEKPVQKCVNGQLRTKLYL